MIYLLTRFGWSRISRDWHVWCFLKVTDCDSKLFCLINQEALFLQIDSAKRIWLIWKILMFLSHVTVTFSVGDKDNSQFKFPQFLKNCSSSISENIVFAPWDHLCPWSRNYLCYKFFMWLKYTIFQFLLVDIWIRSNIISKLGKKLWQSYYKDKKLRQPFISKWGKRFFEVWQEHLFRRWANLFQSGSVIRSGA